MPARRLAAVDIGTNSVLLLIVELQPDGQLRTLHEECRATRLGQGRSDQRGLDPAAVARTVEGLEQLAATMAQLSVSWRGAVGTAVLRRAPGADAARRSMEAALGCPVEVVSGEREAQLALAGARGSLGALPGRCLLLDVGGGSTELVLCQDDQPRELSSLPLGAVWLTERHLDQDPPAAEQLASLDAEVARQLSRLADPPWGGVQRLVGSGGTVTTLATMKLGLERYDTEQVNRLQLKRSEVAQQAARLAALPLEQRRQVAGLPPARADIIIAGASVVATVMDHFGARDLQVCDRGVRWGLIWEQLARR